MDNRCNISFGIITQNIGSVISPIPVTSNINVKQSRYRPGVAQRVPVS
jgi:hypothetical protein